MICLGQLCSGIGIPNDIYLSIISTLRFCKRGSRGAIAHLAIPVMECKWLLVCLYKEDKILIALMFLLCWLNTSNRCPIETTRLCYNLITGLPASKLWDLIVGALLQKFTSAGVGYRTYIEVGLGLLSKMGPTMVGAAEPRISCISTKSNVDLAHVFIRPCWGLALAKRGIDSLVVRLLNQY